MIKLIFTYDKEVLIFEVNNKNIRYYDRKWQKGINFIPKDLDFMRQVILSRNRISHKLIQWIEEANSGKSFDEWTLCKDDEEVVAIVIRDAKAKGCVLRDTQRYDSAGVLIPKEATN